MADVHKVIAQIIAAAWEDSKFRDKLTQAGDDRSKIDAVLKEKGIKLPKASELPGGKLRFVANTADSKCVLIPEKPKYVDEHVDLSVKMSQLESIDTNCAACTGSHIKSVVGGFFHKIFGK
jgi:hypothetical protein